MFSTYIKYKLHNVTKEKMEGEYVSSWKLLHLLILGCSIEIGNRITVQFLIFRRTCVIVPVLKFRCTYLKLNNMKDWKI